MKLLIIIAGRNDLKRSETIMSTKVMIQLIADYFKAHSPEVKRLRILTWIFLLSTIRMHVYPYLPSRTLFRTHTPSRICEPVPARGYDRAQG